VDFALGETQQAVAAAAAPVLDHRHPPSAAATEPGEWGDRALWKELGQAGLLGIGGDGLGVMDTAVLLTEIGRRAAPVPALATLAMGALPVVRWGGRDLQRTLLDGVTAGDSSTTSG
jgi:3-oxo-4-pregnene-20-carboxyl-CoA dehydrogenase alpha subunit